MPTEEDRKNPDPAAGASSETTAGPHGRPDALAALAAVNADLAALDDPARLAASLCRTARDLVAAPWTIVMARLDGDAAAPQVCVSAPDESAAARTAAAIERDDPFPEVEAPARLAIDPGRAWPPDLPGSGSLMLLPIRSAARAYGWICCLAARPDAPFHHGDERVLAALGLLAGRILEGLELRAHVGRQEAERRQAEQRLDAQYEVARILAETSSLDEAAPALLAAICQRLDFAFGILRDIDRRDQVLRSATVWHEPDEAVTVFALDARERSFSAGSGMTGTAWTSRRPVWIADCRTDRRFMRKKDAATAGLICAAAFPVFARGEIVGVLSFLGRGHREERPEVMELLAALGSQIGQFVERRRQDAEIARLNRLYAVRSSVNGLARDARAPQELYDGICRIFVDRGDLGIAAIGTYDAARGEVDFVAGSGNGVATMIAAPPLPLHETPRERLDEAGLAIVDAQPAVNNDLTATPGRGGPRRRAAVMAGYQASAAMPLIQRGQVHGVLILFSRDRDIFAGPYLDLLIEVAGDISYALDHLANRDRLAYLAHHDPLTGLPNRALFRERLGQALIAARRSASRLAVLFIDVRRLQPVNDMFGREAGDAVLAEFARRLLSAVRSPENLARIDGDRFATFTSEGADPVVIANRIEQAAQQILAEAFVVKGLEVQIAGAVGIAVFPDDAEDVETLLRNVEAAVVNAKTSGQEYLFYEPSLNARIGENLRFQGRLKRAVDRKQFMLHHQPKLDARVGTIRGVEALLRWHDPDTGPVPPSLFIPILEETGLIHEVGTWVMRRALCDQRMWLAAGRRPTRVAVNVSALQFQSPQFVAMVHRLIEEFADVREAGGGLDIEITESMVMQDIPANVAKLQELQHADVSVAIDDFGTGYSSLAYLSRLPIQALKIDRSFVRLLGSSPEDLTIVSTIISLAHALNLQVIGEGVETEDQAHHLRLLDCDQMQGFLFHPPMPPDQLARLLPEM